MHIHCVWTFRHPPAPQILSKGQIPIVTFKAMGTLKAGSQYDARAYIIVRVLRAHALRSEWFTILRAQTA